MSQQPSNLPRFVQIVGRYRVLVAVMALFGALAGAVVAALSTSASTSQTMVMFKAPTCPAGAICGGPMFSPAYIKAALGREFGSAVRVKPLDGNVLSISVTAGSLARAQYLAEAASVSFISDAGSVTYMGQTPTASVLGPELTTVTRPIPLKRVADDVLFGLLAGAVVGLVAALAGGQTLIDPPALPRWLDANGQYREGQRGIPLFQLALESSQQADAPET
jgi:hypothetical protein